MRYLKYLALLTVLMVPLAYSQAQVRVGIGVGVAPVGVYAGPPVCAYGYYDYYPYTCAPYGYYGPDYFVDGVFIGAGPWYHWGHPAYFWNRGYYGRGYYRGYYGRGWDHERWERARGWDRDGWRHERYGRGYDRGYGNGFRGDHEFRGGGHEFHGDRGFHGGRR